MAKDSKADAALSVEELKAKYGAIYQMDVPMSDDTEEVLILKKVNRLDFAAGSKIMQKDEMQGVEYFLRALTVQGDAEKVIKDFDALRSSAELLAEIITVKTGKLVKL